METSLETSTIAQPLVIKNESSVTESSQESKVEKIANGTVETAASSEKTVSQSVITSNDQAVQQKSVIAEVKQESSFSSSSVVVDEKPNETDVQPDEASEVASKVVEKENENSLEPENVRQIVNTVESVSEKQIENSVDAEQTVVNSVDAEQPLENSVDAEQPLVNSVHTEQPLENSVATEQPLENSIAAEQPLENSVEPEIAKPLENSLEQEASDLKNDTEPASELKSEEQKESTNEVHDETKEITKIDQSDLNGQPETVVEEQQEPEQTTISQNSAETHIEEQKIDEQVNATDQGESAFVPTSLSAPLPAILERSYETSPTEELPSKILDIAQPAPVVAEEKPEVKQEVLTRNYQQFSNKEIEQESIKKQLNDIITDIEKNVQITNDDATENLNIQSSKQLREHLAGRDLAYRPSVPQGWNRPPVVLQAGMYTPPEIPIMSSTTSSVSSSEKISKFTSTSTTSTSFQDVFSSESSTIKQEQVAPAPIVLQQTQFVPQQLPAVPQQQQFVPQQQQFVPPMKHAQQPSPLAQYQQQMPRPYSGSGQSYPPIKLHTPISYTMPQTVVKPQTPTPVVKPQTPTPVVKPQTPTPVVKPQTPTPVVKPQTPVAFPVQTTPIQMAISPAPMKPMTPVSMPSSRSSYNASPVTPGILKKQMQLDAAVPVPPGGIIPSQSPVSSIRMGAKSPVPFINTAPAPYAPQFPALSVQTPETIAQIAPAETPLVPPLYDPAHQPLPLIVNTPLPKYSSCYNNAARPFNEFKDFYRPIHMEEGKKMLPPLIYTDF